MMNQLEMDAQFVKSLLMSVRDAVKKDIPYGCIHGIFVVVKCYVQNVLLSMMKSVKI